MSASVRVVRSSRFFLCGGFFRRFFGNFSHNLMAGNDRGQFFDIQPDFFSLLIGINDIAALGLLTSLASVYPVFGLVNRMNRKGIIMNMAFGVSAAFVFGGHLAYTIMFDASMTLPVIIAKLTAGFAALIVAHFVGREAK